MQRNWSMVGDFSESRDNNFNLLRFLAAFAVVFSHSAIVIGGDFAIEPLHKEVGYTLGHLAVNIFFVISGFLIAQSLIRSVDIVDYFSARFLRLIPGLLVAAIVTAFLVGPAFTNLGLAEYFSQFSVWSYVPLTGSLLIDNGQLPGVFANAPFALELNTPLWTLRWEALAYVGLAVLGVLGLMSTKLRFAIVFGLFVVLYFGVTVATDLRENIAPADHLMRFGLCFLMGSGFYIFRKQIPVSLALAVPICMLPFVVHDTPLYQFALISALAYATFWLAYVPKGFVRQFNKIGDFSYGIYIYGFPIKQIVISMVPAADTAQLLLIATPIILIVAALSYYLIEKPALRQRKKLAASLRSLMRRPLPVRAAAE